MSEESLRPLPCRRPQATVEGVCQGSLAGLCLGLAFRPTPSVLLSSSFFGGFGMYTYFVIRCNLLCLTSGESVLSPKYASPLAGFFAGSASAFLARLPPAPALAVTLGSAAVAGALGLEESYS